jgi:hypothetical protein
VNVVRELAWSFVDINGFGAYEYQYGLAGCEPDGGGVAEVTGGVCMILWTFERHVARKEIYILVMTGHSPRLGSQRRRGETTKEQELGLTHEAVIHHTDRYLG